MLLDDLTSLFDALTIFSRKYEPHILSSHHIYSGYYENRSNGNSEDSDQQTEEHSENDSEGRSGSSCDKDSEVDCKTTSRSKILPVADVVLDAVNYRPILMKVPKQIEAILVLTDNHPTISRKDLTSRHLSAYKSIIADGWALSRIRQLPPLQASYRVYVSSFNTTFLPDPLYSRELKYLSSFLKVHKLFNSVSSHSSYDSELEEGDGAAALADIQQMSTDYSEDVSPKEVTLSTSEEGKDVVTFVNNTMSTKLLFIPVVNQLWRTVHRFYFTGYDTDSDEDDFEYSTSEHTSTLKGLGYLVHLYALFLCIIACIVIGLAYVLHMLSLCSSCCTGCSIFSLFLMTTIFLLFPVLLTIVGAGLSEGALFIYD